MTDTWLTDGPLRSQAVAHYNNSMRISYSCPKPTTLAATVFNYNIRSRISMHLHLFFVLHDAFQATNVFQVLDFVNTTLFWCNFRMFLPF